MTSDPDPLHLIKAASSTLDDPVSLRRVLVFPAGTEIGLEIHAALCGYHDIELIGAGEPVSNHARFVFPEYHEIPSVHAPSWLEQLIRLCRKRRIQYIFPAHDDVVVALSNARANVPAKIVTSNDDVCRTTRSKSATYRRLEGIIPVPHVYSSVDEVEHYPVLVKPDRGQGSSNVRRVDDAEQLTIALRLTPDPIICEYLPGEEYTVDCFSSGANGLLFAAARRRNRTRNGISVNTNTVDLPEVRELAIAIDNEIKPRGAWFFQIKLSAMNVLTLLEIAPRIAGAMATHRMTGVNFARLSLLDIDDHDIRILTNPGAVELDRALCNRYKTPISFDALYIDMEDTLLHSEILDERVMQLVCKSLNEDVHLVLITEQELDAMTAVARRITSLFDEVVQARPPKLRSSLIRAATAIYVDNNFERRLEVSQSKNIATFDVSMIELLYGCTRDTRLKR